MVGHLYGAEHVTYARNITDVDDKINARAAEEHPGLPLNEAIRTVTEKTERNSDADARSTRSAACAPDRRAARHRAHR